jgi:hypothetical protein
LFGGIGRPIRAIGPAAQSLERRRFEDPAAPIGEAVVELLMMKPADLSWIAKA